MTNKLSADIRSAIAPHVGSNTLDRWTRRAVELEDQLSGTAARARDFEIQASTLTGDLNTMHDELEHSRQLNKDLRDSYDRVAQERDKARVDRDEAHAERDRARLRRDELQQQLADLTTNRDQIAYALSAVQEERDRLAEQVISWQNSSLRNANDRDANAQEAAGLRAALRAATQQGGTGTACAKPRLMGVAPEALHTACGGSSSVGCSSGVSASETPLEALARRVLLESLNNGKWLEYPELRNFVINRFKD